MRNLAWWMLIGGVTLLGAMFYALGTAPSKRALLQQTFRLPERGVLLSTTGRSVGIYGDTRSVKGTAVFKTPQAFDAYVTDRAAPPRGEFSWPLLGDEQRPVHLNDAVAWRKVTPADAQDWREWESLGRPAGEGRILCFEVVPSGTEVQGVACDDATADAAGTVWAGLDLDNRTLYMHVTFDEALGGTGSGFLDFLAENAGR